MQTCKNGASNHFMSQDILNMGFSRLLSFIGVGTIQNTTITNLFAWRLH
jgi:hypothetical protein